MISVMKKKTKAIGLLALIPAAFTGLLSSIDPSIDPSDTPPWVAILLFTMGILLIVVISSFLFAVV